MTKPFPNWTISDEDRDLIHLILDRAAGLRPIDRLELQMDLIACHNHGQPLRLKDLSEADDFNLAHDVFGITRHIDRSNGQLLNCFRPRYSAH